MSTSGTSTGGTGRAAVVIELDRVTDIGRQALFALRRSGCAGVVASPSASGFPEPDTRLERSTSDAPSWFHMECDPTSEESVEHLADRCLAHLGRVDFVVMNYDLMDVPGTLPSSDVHEDHFDAIVLANLRSVFLTLRTFAKLMISEEAGGAIVTISTIAGELALPGQAAYCSSKAAVRALNACVATELGQYGIRVNTICTGWLGTSERSLRTHPKPNVLARGIPLGTPGSAQDVADCVAFLCSDHGKWITGEHINIDGGQSLVGAL